MQLLPLCFITQLGSLGRGFMDIGVLGINYKSSELDLRESFAKACEGFENETNIPIVLLSTCNRTEIYFSSDHLLQTYSEIVSALKRRAEYSFEKEIYSYFAEHCFSHLAKVCSGADSVIFGEAEIQRQVKMSYEKASKRQMLPASLHYLFQKNLKIGKEIRTEFSLPKGAVSIESTIWNLASCFFSKERPLSILLVGYSKINRKVIHFLKDKEGVILHLVTRNPSLIEEKGVFTLLPWSLISSWSSFDMVISGSKCSKYLLFPQQIPQEASSIQSKLVIDLGVPRNVDPAIGKNPLITLCNIEDIAGLIDHKKVVSFRLQKTIEQKIEQLAARQAELYRFRKEKVLICI